MRTGVLGSYGSGMYARTPEGLWVRARVEVGDVVVACQNRHVVNGTRVTEVRPDQSMSETSGRKVKFGDTWIEAGRICLDRTEILTLCALDELHHLQAGLMRHVTGAIAGGWGETIEQVVSWYERPEECTWLFATTYELAVASGPYEGMTDMSIVVEEIDYEKKKMSGRLKSEAEEWPIEMEGVRKLGEMLIYFGLSA